MSAYYISKKSFSVWISLAFALISLFAGVNYYFSAPTGSSIIHITGIAGLPVAAIFFVFSKKNSKKIYKSRTASVYSYYFFHLVFTENSSLSASIKNITYKRKFVICSR